ncbi:MAG: glycoside hydrolase family 5 protein [Christensenellaceae bacterium]|nr:glycoside hydrolase family 5 protein [Christensenellaceae bacterium]
MANDEYQGAAGKFYERMGTGWNLGNTLDATNKKLLEVPTAPSDYETAWHNPVTTLALIETVKTAGFGTIRVPVTWANHIGPAPDYRVDEAWMNRVREVVDMVLDAGLCCILNVHHDTGVGGWLHASEQHVKEASGRFAALWRQIAERFRDDCDRLIFEGFNEVLDEHNNWVYPRTQSAKDAINHFNQLFVDTVRATGGPNANRCLVITPYGAANMRSALEDLVMPRDTADHAMLVQFHYYSPISYCFDRDGDENTQTVWTENGGREALEEALEGVRTLFTEKGIPAIMGEFAAGHKQNEADRAEWTKFVVDTCAASGVKCVWWDNGGRVKNAASYSTMGLLDRYRLEWMFPRVVEALTGVKVTNVSAE